MPKMASEWNAFKYVFIPNNFSALFPFIHLIIQGVLREAIQLIFKITLLKNKFKFNFFKTLFLINIFNNNCKEYNGL